MVFRPRYRIANFRIDDEELSLIRAAAKQAHARSASEFARSAVLAAAKQILDESSTPISMPVSTTQP